MKKTTLSLIVFMTAYGVTLGIGHLWLWVCDLDHATGYWVVINFIAAVGAFTYMKGYSTKDISKNSETD
jgi:hypothetical protein